MSKKKERSAKNSGRPTGWVVLVLILVVTNAATLYYFLAVNNSVPAEDVPMDIGDISAANVGSVVSVLGYYIYAAANHLLVLDPMYYFNNSLTAGNYIILSGEIPSSMDQYLGQQVSVKGTVEVADAATATMGLHFGSFVARETSPSRKGIFRDSLYAPYASVFANISHIYDPSADKFAVLYSGGIDPNHAYSRYWNDIIYMYFILQMYGYKSSNIYVIYKNGVGNDPYTPVNYPATHSSMNTVFANLSQVMGGRDTLFFYTTNHGGGGGISVWDAMDSSGALTQNQVAAWLDSITCHNMIIVMEQCVSGKFIQYISAANRVIMTAAKNDESSYSADTEGNWDEFVYHFMCALTSFAWNGDHSTIYADFNNDGKISMREAFIWAAIKDSRPETPWYNDNGNGLGYNVLEVVIGSGPWYGDGVYL